MAKKKVMDLLFGKKPIWRTVFNVVAGSAILVFLGFVFNLISSLSEVMAVVFSLVITALFLAFSLSFHKGDESFIRTIPRILLLTAVAFIIGQFISVISFSVSLTEISTIGMLSSVALLFGSYYMSDGLFDKYFS